MEIGKKFNQLSFTEYIEILANHKLYSDFNTLGLYRSLLENEKLRLDEKLEIREKAHLLFAKTFDFLQLKDPSTYLGVQHLEHDLNKVEERQEWEKIKKNQEKILKKKKLNHRNFGTYSKHDCGYDWCPYNGLMIRQGSQLAESSIHFKTDKEKTNRKEKSLRNKQLRKNKRNFTDDLDD